MSTEQTAWMVLPWLTLVLADSLNSSIQVSNCSCREVLLSVNGDVRIWPVGNKCIEQEGALL